MKVKKQQTYNVTPKDITKEWHLINAAGKPLGKVAERAEKMLGQTVISGNLHTQVPGGDGLQPSRPGIFYGRRCI